jgi:hypothetical protein
MFLTQTITAFDHEDILPECVISLIDRCSEAIKSFIQRRLQSPSGQARQATAAAAAVAAEASNDAPAVKHRVVVEPPPRLYQDETEPTVKTHNLLFYVPPPPLAGCSTATALSL